MAMNAWMGLKASEGVRERLLASCCGPIVDVLTFDKIVGRVAISGSKLRGLTRRWVELFILPEQLPSPSPFFGRAESVAEMIEAKRRVSRLKECLRLADEVLALVPTQQQMPPSVRQKEGYFFAGSSEQISSWKKDNAGVVTPETYAPFHSMVCRSIGRKSQSSGKTWRSVSLNVELSIQIPAISEKKSAGGKRWCMRRPGVVV
jgi:hypothetical protein